MYLRISLSSQSTHNVVITARVSFPFFLRVRLFVPFLFPRRNRSTSHAESKYIWMERAV